MANHANPPEMWRDLDKRPARIRPLPIGEITVLVVADDTDLSGFTGRVWEEIDSFCSSHGARNPVTEEELKRYFATALAVRVKHINRQGPREIRVEDRWCLPFPMQYIVSAVGVVELESPMVTVVPKVAEGVEDLLLDRGEWERITRRLASLEPLGLRSAKALEAKREGVARVMCLLLARDSQGTTFYSNEPFTVVDALTAKAAGLRTSVDMSNVFSSNPLWTPPYVMDGNELLVFEHKFASIGAKPSPA